MSTAANGRAREHRVRRHMETCGWRQIMRAAGSKGSADLFMAHPDHGGALVQVGTPSKTLGPAERARLLADATDTGSLAILAVVVPGHGVRYWQINHYPPSRWDAWHPGPEETA